MARLVLDRGEHEVLLQIHRGDTLLLEIEIWEFLYYRYFLERHGIVPKKDDKVSIAVQVTDNVLGHHYERIIARRSSNFDNEE